MNTSPKHAFVLDDDSGVQKLVSTLLVRCGYTVTSYFSPAETTIYNNPVNCPLLSTHKKTPDKNHICAELIITDINMPFFDGIEYIRRLRQAGCKVRHVAIMSGAWDKTKLLEAKTLKCKIFSKPLKVGEILEWLKTLEP
jgi:CheY-like chemotaxis protein